MKLIGITGYKRSGKDTVAARLVDAHGFRRFAFADPLKEAALALDPIVDECVPGVHSGDEIRLSTLVDALGWEEAKSHPEVRRTLQRFGVGIRKIIPSFWVDALALSIAEEREAAKEFGEDYADFGVVVPDVRFENEEQWIHANGGILARVTRPGTGSDGHISEELTATLLADVEIANDGSLADLAQEVDRLVT